ncbi:GNAT family N-acetyltransferase [Paenibacillus spiritus]|uniref:GNAT family N-acetyltransferase n=1 Tax=Paenibacillus spiritus TaxID=2496557 RepID=A0A5J5GLW2_9BACL|nr:MULTISPECIES: GNAT family N-acetyltransferase [Paenibacillus]KAA9008608.1 GNAT family N-acetyltransferase [Paenibacillus spiritus]
MIVSFGREHIDALSDWGETLVSRGKVHALRDLDGFVYIYPDEPAGFILYRIEDRECEIVLLESRREGQGVGAELIATVLDRAREKHCLRVWLITSNDNIKAIRYYQKRGFDLAAVHRHAITEARKLKPSIPLIGLDGIEIKHEIEFEYKLEPL